MVDVRNEEDVSEYTIEQCCKIMIAFLDKEIPSGSSLWKSVLGDPTKLEQYRASDIMRIVRRQARAALLARLTGGGLDDFEKFYSQLGKGHGVDNHNE